MKNNLLHLRVYFVAVFAMCCTHVIAQVNRAFPVPSSPVLLPGSTPGWYNFDENSRVNASDVLTTYKALFGLSASDDMRLLKSNTDPAGNSHTKYKQYYKGLPVEGTQLTVHARSNNTVYLVTGYVIRGINLSVGASISEAAALQTALRMVPAKKYLWQDNTLEAIKKKAEKNMAATAYPKGTLCIYPTTRNDQLLTSDFSLGWMFDIYVIEGAPSSRVFVNLPDGTVRNFYKLGWECNGGSASTTFNGSRTIYTKKDGNVYNMFNDCQTTIIHTYNLFEDSTTAQRLEFATLDNNWTGAGWGSKTQTHFGATQTYNYYKNAFSRNSWDNNNGEMTSYWAPYGTKYANACWGCLGNAAQFGIGPSVLETDDWTTLDIVGHEFTHGVVQDETGNEYWAQSGALNESYADIFGEMVEQTTEGQTASTSIWQVAEDRGAIRSFANPKSGGQPDTYKGINWYRVDTCQKYRSGDNCGVHTNSGVQNYFFYLLSKGGTGTNDNGSKYTVQGIGTAKAATIAYYSLINYLGPFSTYIEARNSSVRVAEELYGACSNEAIQTAKAWYAVGADVESGVYNNYSTCAQITTNNAAVTLSGINSFAFNSGICNLTTQTATNYPLTIQAGNYVMVGQSVVLKSTGTQPVLITPSNCAYTGR